MLSGYLADHLQCTGTSPGSDESELMAEADGRDRDYWARGVKFMLLIENIMESDFTSKTRIFKLQPEKGLRVIRHFVSWQ